MTHYANENVCNFGTLNAETVIAHDSAVTPITGSNCFNLQIWKSNRKKSMSTKVYKKEKSTKEDKIQIKGQY